ncbi:MAG: 2-succinyl-5-enolpyruvyl-6-hydroxy-3-cyclohexene-1-carboxylic-acid synthase [Cyanobacteria bacterium SBC]|nr:2-succinyl-5-enolpyruvyl-6-hydroxy-3-cyclohexene-1-carboxylic-acid synthase [Cyanobacteria bacterium SBC]
MAVDFRNTNTVWASVAVETLARLGLQTAVICPGSRSTPLTLAFAAHPDLEAIPVLDERSAAFFALGIAKQTGRATALVCTSGTAGANFFPAVVEARESRVPLLVLTADRPPELRHCRAGQAIDQLKLYGHYPTWQAELATPALDRSLLRYLRQTMVRAWERTRFPVSGVVHLNVPFRDPLPPLPQPEADTFSQTFPEDFFDGITPCKPGSLRLSIGEVDRVFSELGNCERGAIVVGIDRPHNPQQYARAIARLSKTLGFPVLADGLSPLRNHAALNPDLISTYDFLLRDRETARNLAPEVVVQIGELPTSKVLREWLSDLQAKTWILDPSDRNVDPLHSKTTHLRISIEQFFSPDPLAVKGRESDFCQRWREADATVCQTLDRTLSDTTEIVEPKIAWWLSQTLPPHTPLFVSNSMPVRDVEWFWRPSDTGVQVFCNRGANGIDGTLSTALGVAQGNRPSVLLTGDLALLHDTNGFLLRRHLRGHLTIVLVNNNGGGIFEMLPIAQFDPPFEDFFATPQSVEIRHLCRAYGIDYCAIESWSHFTEALRVLPETGVRLLELRTDRKADAAWRQRAFKHLAIL